MLAQVFREAGARAGVDAQEACGGKACENQEGRGEGWGEPSDLTAAAPGRRGQEEAWVRTVSGCSRFAERFARQMVGSLSQGHLLEESAILQDLQSAQSLSGSSPGKVWLQTSAVAGRRSCSWAIGQFMPHSRRSRGRHFMPPPWSRESGGS